MGTIVSRGGRAWRALSTEGRLIVYSQLALFALAVPPAVWGWVLLVGGGYGTTVVAMWLGLRCLDGLEAVGRWCGYGFGASESETGAERLQAYRQRTQRDVAWGTYGLAVAA